MKRLLLVVPVLLWALTACNNEAEPEFPSQFPTKGGLIGLASPIQLNDSVTTVFLEDYFLEPEWIEAMEVPVGMTAKKEGTTLLLSGTLDTPLGELRLLGEGGEYNLLLKRYKKQQISYRFDPQGKTYEALYLKGEMNDWNPSKTPLKLVDGVWQTTLALYPGRYQYLLVSAAGEEFKDPEAETVSNGIGGFNSLLAVNRVSAEELPLLETFLVADELVQLTADRADEVFVFWDNSGLDHNFVSRTEHGKLLVRIPEEAKLKKRSFLRVWSANKFGESNDLLIPLEQGRPVREVAQLDRFDKETSLLYFMLVDRFNNGNPDNDQPLEDERVKTPANYQGGDLAGIHQKLEEGYFEKLNINTLWLSPITQNPLEAYQEYPAPHRFYSGYHGYWPITFTTIDHRLGKEAELKALVDAAHERGMNVILDFVSNHVHEEHPFYKEHPDWATQLDLEDGRKNIRIWEEQRLTTWFDTFLPSLDFTVPEVTETLTDSALFWIKHYELDGFRHDATKHIPVHYWRTLTSKLKKEVMAKESKRIFQVGETFGSRELIGSYVGSGQLDGQFDFNLYFDAVSVFQDEETSMKRLEESMRSTFDFYGSHSLMANITGNHDLTRFITLAGDGLQAGEDHKEAGWAREVKVENPLGYARLKQLTAFILTIPGVPVIFYGDDIGMPGANDPDNRRMMRFDNLSEEEASVQRSLRKMTKLRKTRMSLLYGDFNWLQVTDGTAVYSRTYFGETTIVAFNKTNEAQQISVEMDESGQKQNFQVQFGSEQRLEGNNLILELAPNSFEVLTNN